jgi:hypothetical protein
LAIRREVLEKRQRVLGDEHPDTITAMSNLAVTLGGLGKLKEVAAMKKEVLEKMRRVLGDEHPNTISAMNNLANTLGDLGKLEEAAAMEKEVLEKRRRVLGDEHPDTIKAMSNLAITIQAQENLQLSLHHVDDHTSTRGSPKKRHLLTKILNKLRGI